MILLLLIFIAFTVWISLKEQDRLTKLEGKFKSEVVAVKQCPPHKWSYVEVKDTNGDTAKWRVVCALCGPMQTQEKPKGGDYT